MSKPDRLHGLRGPAAHRVVQGILAGHQVRLVGTHDLLVPAQHRVEIRLERLPGIPQPFARLAHLRRQTWILKLRHALSDAAEVRDDRRYGHVDLVAQIGAIRLVSKLAARRLERFEVLSHRSQVLLEGVPHRLGDLPALRVHQRHQVSQTERRNIDLLHQSLDLLWRY